MTNKKKKFNRSDHLKNAPRDELGRLLPKDGIRKKPVILTRKRKNPETYTVQFSDQDGGLMKNTPLFKEIQSIEGYIKSHPLDTIEQIVTKDLAVLTSITDGVLKAALAEGEILQDGKVNRLLNQSNYLAFQSARRQTLNCLLKLEQLKATRKAKKRPQGRPKKKTDLEILMER